MISISELNYRNRSASVTIKRLKDEIMTLKRRVIQNGLTTLTNGSKLNRN
jgi:hypothetical protein